MDTWIIIKIGKREYAVNSKYVTAVTELRNETLIIESTKNFVRGVYNIFNLETPVIDGYKLTKEQPKNDIKLLFSKELTELKIIITELLDSSELALVSDSQEEIDEINRQIKNIIEKITPEYKSFGDKYLDKLSNKLISNTMILLNRVSFVIQSKLDRRETFESSSNKLTSIRKECDRQIFDIIDNIIDCYNSRISEMCIIFKVTDLVFGISIDSVELVKETETKNDRNKRTILSMGTITIDEEVYNVLDLSKLKNIIK